MQAVRSSGGGDGDEGAPLRAAGDSPTDTAETDRLHAVADAARHRLELLLEVSEALAGSLDPEEVIETLGRLLVPNHADHIMVDLVRGDGIAQRRIVAHGERAGLAARLEATAAPWPPPGTPAAIVLAGNPPILMSEIPVGLVAATSGDEQRQEMAARMGPRSGLAVPLLGRERVLGALSLVSTDESGRHYVADDLAFTVEIGRRAGLVIEVAQLYQAAQESARRIASLQSFTAALASAAAVVDVADLTAKSARQAVGGNTSSLCLLEDGGLELELLAECGEGRETKEALQRFSADAPVPTVDAMRTRRPVLLTSLRDRDARYPVLVDTPTVDTSFAVVPLLVDDVAVGALTVGFAHEQVFDVDEVSLLLAIAGQCAQAVQRARLIESERTAAAHKAFLADASGVLNSTLVIEHTLDQLTGLLVSRFADSAVVHLDHGTGLKVVAMQHVDPDSLSAMRALVGRAPAGHVDPNVSAVAASGVPLLLRDVPEELLEEVAEDDEALRLLHRLDLRSTVIVALRSKGHSIGTISLGRGDGRARFDGDDLVVIEDLVALAANAVDNALNYEARVALADALQASLLPPALPAPVGLDLSVRYRPVGGGVIGGDFYDVFSINGGTTWHAVMGDVCGKGPEAAAITSLVRHTIRATARTGAFPAAILEACNEAIQDNDLGDRFATIIVAAITVEGRGARLQLANGGHPPPVVRRADGALEEVTCDGMAVGLFGDAAFAEVAVALAPGDDLILFTDGLLEARSPSGAFAPQLLNQVLRATSGASCDETAGALLGAIDAFEAGRPRDDLAVLIIRASRPGLPLVQVRTTSTPSEPFIAADEHLDELLRELEVIRIGRRQGVSGTAYPQRLLAVLDELLARQADVRSSVRDQAELASVLGHATFASELTLPVVAAVVLRQLQQVLDELERHMRAGELLTLPPSHEAAAALRSWLSEVCAGLDAGSATPAGAASGGLPAAASPSLVSGEMSDMVGGLEARLIIPASDAMARAARQFLREVFRSWGSERLIDRMELPLSEIVTNAQIHTRGQVEVIVRADGALVRVEVQDGSSILPVWRHHEGDAGTGRGLRLVEAYTDRWGACSTPAGKYVWIEVAGED